MIRDAITATTIETRTPPTQITSSFQLDQARQLAVDAEALAGRPLVQPPDDMEATATRGRAAVKPQGKVCAR